ncbi:MAG: NADPH:quinone oxidoreductase family protein [Gammaproteobacteria bacterium]|nr:NADPH:quinone oxidoreductase family protein [Gammaproteobacteria bacterium]
MHSWLCSDPRGYQLLEWKETPTPKPISDQVLVRISAASMNYPDALIVANKYQYKPSLPFVPGSEFSGFVEQIGDEVEHLRIGQKVVCITGTGGFATHALVLAKNCTVLPDDFDLLDAAAFPMIYATSYYALVYRGCIQPSDTVLVLGAAGGVGSSAIQIAKLLGCQVIAASSTEEKSQFCKQLGADHVINYSTTDLRQQLKELTADKGPNIIYDPIGGAMSEQAFRSIAWGGRHLVIGFAAGEIPQFPLNLTLLKGASLVGVFWGAFAQKQPQDNLKMMNELFDLYKQQKLKPPIHQTLPMSEIKSGFETLLNRQILGKLVFFNK